tara:strand:+ start:286 stop:993 length:708 start_codon:yes stop_codon:yes gene_type:complete
MGSKNHMPSPKPPTNLAEALTLFQQEHHAAGKDGKANYGFYTTLAGGLNAVQPATHLGLCHTQTFDSTVTDSGQVITILVTTLKHISGEEIVSRLPFPELVPNRGNIMQALGSAITYARRYALLAIYGLAGDDDDAESSAPKEKVEQRKGIARTPTQPKQVSSPPPTGAPEFIAPAFKSQIEKDLRSLTSDDLKKVLGDFKKEFKISAKEISPNHITTKAHGDYLAKMVKEKTAV